MVSILCDSDPILNAENEWNIFWASVVTVKQIFNPENGVRLSENQ